MTTDVAQALPTRIGVVGCGLMGSGIAEVVARAATTDAEGAAVGPSSPAGSGT